MHSCTEEDKAFLYEVTEEFELSFRNSFCLDNPFDYQLKGTFTDTLGSALIWSLDWCTEDCKSQDEIEEFLQTTDIFLIYNE